MSKVTQSLAPARLGTLSTLALLAAVLVAGCGQKGPLSVARPLPAGAAPSASSPASP